MIPDGVLRTKMGAYVLRDDTCLSRWVERDNALDIPMNIREIASFAHLIPEGGTVIDAGACLGDHALTYSQIVGAAGHVYAYEPHPVTYQALALNMARLNNVTTYELALSDAPGVRQFMPDPNIGASFFADAGTVTARCSTLDEMVGPCDFLHLDAEGWESRILQGGRALIERCHPVMVIELCDKHLRRAGSSELELIGLIQSFGYTVRSIPEHIEPELRDVLCVWGLAVVLAAIGLYSVLAYDVAERRLELGVRSALGAATQRLALLVIGRGVRAVAAGTVIGAAVSLLLGHRVAALLFQTSARDPFVFVAVAGVLFVVTVAATLVPAVRAARTDPMEALRGAT